jgi:hypothetical protein
MSDDFKKENSEKTTELDKAARIDRALKSILNEVKNDADFRKSLLHESGISKKKFHNELESRVGFKVPVKFYRNPGHYKLVREIRFKVEGVKYSLDEVKIVYSDLVAEIKAQPHKTTAELSNRNRDLYKRVIETGHSKLIWFLSGFGDMQHCFYLPDQELVKQCGQFSSFTELKYRGKGDLHLHIKARGLEQQIVFEYPSYLSHFYVGINNKFYRSLAELAIGNMCEFNQEAYEFEASYGISREGSDKSMVCDFLFFDSEHRHVYLEIVQNTEATRGDRRENYADRHQEKLDMLHKHGIFPVCVTTDNFYEHGLFNSELFAYEVSRRLSERGVDLKEVPATHILSMQNSEYAEFLISSDQETIYKHLMEEKGVLGIADFDNHYSTIKNILKARADNFLEFFYLKLKTRSNKQRSSKNASRHKGNRDEFMPLFKLKQVVKKYQIKNQSQWFKFARENREYLKENKIPCDVANVYKRRGEWISWPDFYGKRVAN